MSKELNQPSNPEKRGSGSRLVASLVTLATLIGGVAAGYQIYEHYRPKAAPRAKHLDAGWKLVKLEGGLSIGIPPTWDVVDKDALTATTRAFTGASDDFLAGLHGRPELTFATEQSNDPDAPTLLAIFGTLEATTSESAQSMADSMNTMPEVQTCSVVKLPYGDAAHAIMYVSKPAPGGGFYDIAMDTYAIPRGTKRAIMIFYVDVGQHVQYSGTIRKIAESLRGS